VIRPDFYGKFNKPRLRIQKLKFELIYFLKQIENDLDKLEHIYTGLANDNKHKKTDLLFS
jgi:hypothetical protein